MQELLEKNLPLELRNRALISPSGDYGWQKQYIFDALAQIDSLGYAVIGLEVWAVDTFQDDKTLTIFKDLFLTVKDVFINDIPCKDGVKRFHWSTEKEKGESWADFVKRSRVEASRYINEMKIEEKAEEYLENTIFYNPVFMAREEYEKMSG